MSLIFALSAILLTSLLSGVLGMGGGILLAGLLAIVLPLASALIIHAVAQLSANSYRAFLHRHAIQWRIVKHYLMGLLVTVGVFLLWRITVDKPVFYLSLGLIALTSQYVPQSKTLNACKPIHAILAGISVTALHLFVGVAGPLLDVFFQKTPLNRFQIISTKATTQSIGHFVRISFYFTIYQQQWFAIELHPIVFLAIIPIAVLGTKLGSKLLHNVNEQQFRHYSRILLQTLGAVFITKGILGFASS